VVQNVVTYTAVIATSNPELELFPGMTANVRIVVDTRENALKVPNAALRFRPAGVADARGGAAPDTAGAAEGESGKGGRGGPAGGDALRERLAKELKLTPEQQAKVELILNDTRDKIRSITTESKGERRRQIERLRGESRTRISEILDPEQRKRYQEMNPARAAGRAVTSARVWLQGAGGEPVAVSIRVGLADGTHSEVVGGELAEGAAVIIGTQAPGKGRGDSPKGGPRFAF
jgi:HlyD family secretion protein